MTWWKLELLYKAMVSSMVIWRSNQSSESGLKRCFYVWSKVKYSIRWILFAHLLILLFIDEPENVRALTELGLGQLSLANFWLDAADKEEEEEEEEEEKEESTTISQEEKNAQDALLKCMSSSSLLYRCTNHVLHIAQEYFEQVLNLSSKTNKVLPRMHADLAEVLINLSNLVSDEGEQQKLYQQAAEHIQNAKSVAQSKELEYELPEGLQLFLEEWSSSQ